MTGAAAGILAILALTAPGVALGEWRHRGDLSRSRLVALGLVSVASLAGLVWLGFRLFADGFAWQPAAWIVGGLVVGSVGFEFGLYRGLIYPDEDASESDVAPTRLQTRNPTWACVRLLSGGGLSNGFIVHPSGVIIANSHSVRSAKTLGVILANGEYFPARALGVYPEWDVAVLKVDTPYALPSARLAESTQSHVGQPLLMLGFESMARTEVVELRTETATYYTPLRDPAAIGLTLMGYTATESEQDISTLISDANASVRPGWSGAMLVSPKNGRVVGMHWGNVDGASLRAIPSVLIERAIGRAGAKARGWRRLRRLPEPETDDQIRRLRQAQGIRYAHFAMSRFDLPCAEASEMQNIRENLEFFEPFGLTIPLIELRAALRLYDGDFDGAFTDAADALAEDPGQLGLLVMEELIDRDPARLDAVQKVLGRVLEDYDARPGNIYDQVAPRFAYSRLRMLFKLERFEETVAVADAYLPAARRSDVEDRLLYWKAQAMWRLGSTEEALACCREFLASSTRTDVPGYVRLLLEEGSEPSLRAAVLQGLRYATVSLDDHEDYAAAVEAARRLGMEDVARMLAQIADLHASPKPGPSESEPIEG